MHDQPRPVGPAATVPRAVHVERIEEHLQGQVEEIARHGGNLQRAEEMPVERLAWNEIDVTDLVADRSACRWPDGPGCASDPRSSRAAVWPRRRGSRRASRPTGAGACSPWSTHDQRDDLPIGIRPAVVPPTPDDDPAASPIRRHRPPDAGHGASRCCRRIVFDPNFGTLSSPGLAMTGASSTASTRPPRSQVQRDRGGPAAPRDDHPSRPSSSATPSIALRRAHQFDATDLFKIDG